MISEEEIQNSDFLKKYIQSEHLGGVIVLDSNLSPIAQADMDHQDSYEIWKEVIEKQSVKFWYGVSLVPQRYDAENQIQAVLSTIRDVTAIKQAEELSFRDKLTGLYNRNYMESRSDKFVREGDRPVSLIMADCNYLKRTNDTLGYEYGDLLLKRVAGIIRDTISENDLAMRVGGDEFAILCTKCTKENANRLIARIKEKMAAESNETLELSVAFGVHTTEEGEFSFAEAYELADQEMYRDKEASRE